jgi:hypothetical protein
VIDADIATIAALASRNQRMAHASRTSRVRAHTQRLTQRINTDENLNLSSRYRHRYLRLRAGAKHRQPHGFPTSSLD